MNAELDLAAVSFDYGRQPVLKEITCSVAKGAIFGILGPRGSGKTTLLKCICGMLTPREGEVAVGGVTIRSLSRRQISRLMAFVPRRADLGPACTALQMVMMGRTAQQGHLHLPSRKDRTEAEQALADLGVRHLAACPFNELSGGERQLVLLARVLHQGPRILILDEPTFHFEPRNQFMVMEIVRQLTLHKGLTTLVSLTDPHLAVRYCTHLTVLKEGRLWKTGATEQGFARAPLPEGCGLDASVENAPDENYAVLPFQRRESR
ncbi:MAG: ABC transporter ATP-binding protein [Deltaproteobacteria bacterium]|nr:ABC transporter ATP-binding protein [Deltaproteobacteria bacterium]